MQIIIRCSDSGCFPKSASKAEHLLSVRIVLGKSVAVGVLTIFHKSVSAMYTRESFQVSYHTIVFFLPYEKIMKVNVKRQPEYNPV